jgi:hypothetical protein
LSHTHLNLVIQHYIGVELKEDIIGCYVQGRDDLLRVAYQLRVEVLVVAHQVAAVDDQEWL